MKIVSTILFMLSCMVMQGQEKAQKFDSLFNSLYANDKFNGNVLVVDSGQIIYNKSFGLANIQENKPLNSQTVFELASVSKQFTAMGIMILKKKGLITYSDSLRHFFPELPYHNITVKHLIQHTSGLPDYMELFQEHWDSSKIAVNKDMIRLLATHKPKIQFPPGTKFEYSNTGYALLASIIEKQSGVSFRDFLEREIFKPLGMTRSTVFSRRLEKRKIDNYAYGYGKNKENKFVLPDEDPDVRGFVYALDGIQGDGTVNASIDDLFIWDRALYTEKLISKAEWEASLETPIFQNNKKSFYGFGWMIDSSKLFGRLMNHSGGWPGYRTFIERHIDHNKCFIILSNMEKGNMPNIAVRNILFDIKPKPGNTFKVSADSLRQYEGKYAITPEFVIKVWLEKGTLNAQATGQNSFELVPEKTDWFSVPIVQAKLQFIRNDKGIVTSMILHQNGQETPGKKMD